MAYKRAPIIQAIFDLQFEAPLSESEMRRLGREFFSRYPKTDEERELKISVLPGQESTSSKFAGLRLTRAEADYILLIRVREFGTCCLPPYKRWEQFEEEAWNNYQVFRKIVGLVKLTRIALRYINRLDIPEKNPDYNQYVRVHPGLPNGLSTSQYQVFSVAEYEGLKLNINCGIIPSPLLSHSSYLIDSDVYLDSDLPSRDEAIRSEFGRLRVAKNKIFEMIITDQARELFNRES